VTRADVHTAGTEHSRPPIVDRERWETERAELLAREKAHTRALDRLNARRRRLPMTEVRTDYRFADSSGASSFVDLFAGRSQLIVYHNMLTADDDWICRGCSMFSDAIAGLAHLHARDTTFVMESAARVPEIEALKARFGWRFPWFSSYGSSFREDFVTSRGHSFALSVFLHHDGRVFQTYVTSGRGVEYTSNWRSLADLTPFGRGESWEDSPPGWPQVPTHSWEELPDEFR
jgi:predicted dithiol-disulfide oxidoreductase (DUF899 family)